MPNSDYDHVSLDYDPYDWDDDFDGDDEEYFDCGFVPGYGCQMAGTEECDFECPHRDTLERSPHYPNCNLFGFLVDEYG